MIISCVMNGGESELLALRGAEEDSDVDLWVLCTAKTTFTGLNSLGETRGPAALRDKTSRVVVAICSFEQFADPWANEAQQRNLATGLRQIDDDDVLIVSDADEIHRRQDMGRIIDSARKHGSAAIVQKFHYYKLNNVSDRAGWREWRLPFAITGQCLKEFRAKGQSLNSIRQRQLSLGEVYTNGHHFSYLASPEEIVAKLRSFSHQEYNRQPFIEPVYIRDCIAAGADLFERETGRVWAPEPLDDSYPLAILDNPDNWKEFIA
jgi:hypothetical protein